MPIESETKNDQDSDDAERHSHKRAKFSCRLLRLDGSRQPHLHRKFQMPTPRCNEEASTPAIKKARYHGFCMSSATFAYVDRPCVSQRSV